jgi:hypothetical protein
MVFTGANAYDVRAASRRVCRGIEMNRLFALAALASVAAFAPAPVVAQDQPGDKVNVVDVFGEDPCPQSSDEEIVVCRRLDEADRYRIPEDLRQSDDPENVSWAQRVKSFEAVGDFGPLSCTPSGLGGELGCTAKMIAAAYEERRTGADARAAEQVAAARQERLATIDEEAAETQARVEALEREYLDRVAREDAGEVAPPTSDAGAEPVVVDPADIAPAE